MLQTIKRHGWPRGKEKLKLSHVVLALVSSSRLLLVVSARVTRPAIAWWRLHQVVVIGVVATQNITNTDNLLSL